MKLIDLNLDCLLRIFSFCNDADLLNLCRANKYLDTIIDEHIYFPRTLDLVMCGHRNAPSIERRTHTPLSYRDRISIANNWRKGCYREYEYCRHSDMFNSKILLERDLFYISYGRYLRVYDRSNVEPLQRRFLQEISTGNRWDITSFAKKRQTLFVGRESGDCYIYEDDCVTEQKLHSSKEYVFCVDFAGDLYATGTERTTKLWRRSDELGLTHLDQAFELNKSYKSLAFIDDGSRLYAGAYTDLCREALREVDLTTGYEQKLNSQTLSIYDIKLKDDNVLFTANFDSTLRMYDRRSNADVGYWEDPFDSSYFCVQYDGLYAVLCGAKYHKRVILFDIRVPHKYQQLYFTARGHLRASSPVYSLACDSRYLFVATDHSVSVLDFKVEGAVSRDYYDYFTDVRRYNNAF